MKLYEVKWSYMKLYEVICWIHAKKPQKKKENKTGPRGPGPRCRWIVTEWIVTAWSFGNCTDVWGNVSRQPGEPGGAGDSWWGMIFLQPMGISSPNMLGEWWRMVIYDVFIEIWIEQLVYPSWKRAGSWKNPLEVLWLHPTGCATKPTKSRVLRERPFLMN